MAAASMPAAWSMSRQPSKTIIIDEKNMLRLWLEEKVARRELTPAQADQMLQDSETQGKLWTGPFKDMLGSAKLVYKLAGDFASWKGARVYFIKGKTGDLVIFKGWPAGRKLVSGTRYRVDNPKIIEMQVGKPGLKAAARESARFGIYLVVAVDVMDYLLRDTATFGQLLGSLTVDIPAVVLASAIGATAGSFVAGTSMAGLAVIGSFACGPFLVAFIVGAAVGYGLFKLDENFHLTERLGDAYEGGLAKLGQVSRELGTAAEQRFRQLANSQLVHDLSRETRDLAARLARESDRVRGELTHL